MVWRNGKRVQAVDQRMDVQVFSPMTNGDSLLSLIPMYQSIGQTQRVPPNGQNYPAVVQAMLYGEFNGDPRWADSFTLVPTFVSRGVKNVPLVMTSADITVPGLPNWGCCGITMGSGTDSLREVTCSGGLGAIVPAWNAGTLYSTGTSSSLIIARPIAHVTRVRYEGYGNVHDVRFVCVPIAPAALTTLPASPATWPTTLVLGAQTANLQQGARTFNLSPGDSVVMCAAPFDNGSLNFLNSTVERALEGYTGWYFWVYGAMVEDMITLDDVYIEECALNYTATGLTPGPYIGTMVEPNTAQLDASLGVVERLIAQGHLAYKERAGEIVKEPVPTSGYAFTGLSSTFAKRIARNFIASPMGKPCTPIVQDSRLASSTASFDMLDEQKTVPVLQNNVADKKKKT